LSFPGRMHMPALACGTRGKNKKRSCPKTHCVNWDKSG
jgi:hypothetical protein